MVGGNPKVTVLMPVYNGETYLREALESILNQTFINFEFLIIDDGSIDGSPSIIKEYQKDPRIRFITNEKNFGLVGTLNRGIDFSQGEYIARMDQDDVSLPERLAKQTAFMDQYPEVGLCGTYARIMGTGVIYQLPVEHQAIKEQLASHNWFIHPTVMMRTHVLRQNHIYYDPEYIHAEDYELWTRLANITQLANIPEVLLYYRIHAGQISRKFALEQIAMANIIRNKKR